MKKRSVVVGSVLTPDWLKKVGTMLAEIFRQLALGIQEAGKGLSLEQVQSFIEHKNPFVKVVQVVTNVFEDILRNWEVFYKENLGIVADFSQVWVPKCPGVGWRFIVIAQDLRPELVFQVSKKIFGKAWKYYDASLDEVIVKNERDPKNDSYTIWVRDGQEADEVHKNKSANQVEAEKLLTETTLERLVHGLKYFRETRKHLDVKTVTLCSGSRCDGGVVPGMHWSSSYDELRVYGYYPDDSCGDLRSREVVS